MGLFSGITKSIFGGDAPKTKRPAPWGPQQEYLKTGFKEAERIYDQLKGTPFYQGPLYAGLTDLQKQAIQGLAGFAGGQGQALADAATGASQAALQAGQGFGSNAQQLFQQAGQDSTQGILSSAAQYADNPYVAGMIDAASRDVRRNLYENELPALNQAATSTGNLNSSRAGVAEGILKRGAEDRIADISAQIRGNAYSQGLNMAQSQYNQNFANQLSANQQLAGALQQGLSGAATAQGIGFGNFDAIARAGEALQRDEQGRIDEAYQRWMGQDNRAFDLLNRYWNIVGAREFGTGSPSMVNTYQKGVLDYAGDILGLFSSGKGSGLFG